MPYQNFLMPALERILAWDLPDVACGHALSNEAGLMAGVNPEPESWDSDD